ncbi:hypothetical protein L7F22_065069, partial [Adiantum nelumboides]|nr:hypothetical protein [Adiantum nelumboides]
WMLVLLIGWLVIPAFVVGSAQLFVVVLTYCKFGVVGFALQHRRGTILVATTDASIGDGDYGRHPRGMLSGFVFCLFWVGLSCSG